jgi:hypothetical protein
MFVPAIADVRPTLISILSDRSLRRTPAGSSRQNRSISSSGRRTLQGSPSGSLIEHIRAKHKRVEDVSQCMPIPLIMGLAKAFRCFANIPSLLLASLGHEIRSESHLKMRISELQNSYGTMLETPSNMDVGLMIQ